MYAWGGKSWWGSAKHFAKRTTQCGPFLVAARADELGAVAAGSPSSGSSVSSSSVKTSYSSDGSETDSDDAEQSLLDALVEARGGAGCVCGCAGAQGVGGVVGDVRGCVYAVLIGGGKYFLIVCNSRALRLPMRAVKLASALDRR